MDLATFDWLLSADGQALLALASAADLSAAAQLAVLQRLRRHAPAEYAAAAYEMALLRRRAATKFAAAERLYFTRDALEQASGEIIAAYRASRYAGHGRIADLGCGIGGDLLALAQIAPVVGVDRDPLRLAMAAANLQVRGLASRATLLEADLTGDPASFLAADITAIFFDPARRRAGQRMSSLADYDPPVASINRWRDRVALIGVKVAPGVGDDQLAGLAINAIEFLSVDGDMKEALLWVGSDAGPQRCATLLSSNPAEAPISLTATDAPPAEPVAPRGLLYEPDPAIIRAGLVGTLAQQLGAAQIDAQIAYLTSDDLRPSRMARCWRILEWHPFNLKRLRARLRTFDTGPVTVKKRGSPLDTDTLARRLSGNGQRPLVVVLTRVLDQPAMLICEGPIG